MSGAAQPIGPGSIVICISTGQNSLSIPQGYTLTKDALYCVDSIQPWAHGCQICGHCTLGFVLRGRTDRIAQSEDGFRILGYCPSQFKPLNDGDTSFVENELSEDDADGAGLQAYRRILEPTT